MVCATKILAVSVIASLLLSACGDSLGDKYVSFADCLVQKEVKIYGAYWCPKCAKQKKMFGTDAFKKINYIECDPRGYNAKPDLCLEKKIQRYPTWEFKDGKMMIGIQELGALSEKTGCSLPQD